MSLTRLPLVSFVHERYLLGRQMRIVIGMTGATGAPLGVALLSILQEIKEVETHLILSKWAKTTIELETPFFIA